MDMSNYKMIYKDQVYNVVGMIPTIGENRQVKFIEASCIDEDGELKILYDEAFMFKFVRR